MTQNHFSTKQEASAPSNKQRKTSVETRTTMYGFSAHKAAEAVESTQWRQYNKATGHGYTAEDVNALNDYLLGNDVNKTGWDNSLNGPDRIVNGVKIQTKYYNTARKSVNAFFNGADGPCKYDGQVLEVPLDQYDEAVRIMQEKIRNGQVPGVDNPADASKIVRAGSVTYEQAVKIAKAGNWESLKFDVKNQVVVTSIAGGVSLVVSFLMAKKNGLSNKEAVKLAGKEAAKTGVITMTAGVATQQLLRTGVGRMAMAVTEKGVKRGLDMAMKSDTGRRVIEKTATAIVKRQVTGHAAKQVLTRAASSNVVTATVTGVVTSIPDTYRMMRGKISGKEYGIRMAERGAGIGGGTVGTWAGMCIGSCICPGVGTTIGGFIGGMLGGISGSKAVSKCLR